VIPARPGDLVRPTRPPDPVAQVGENVLVHRDGERLDRDPAFHPGFQLTKRSTIRRHRDLEVVEDCDGVAMCVSTV
jgi:hypothetical protein